MRLDAFEKSKNNQLITNTTIRSRLILFGTLLNLRCDRAIALIIDDCRTLLANLPKWHIATNASFFKGINLALLNNVVMLCL